MKLHKILVLLSVVLISAALFVGCHPEQQTGEYIIDAEDAIALLQSENTVLVDTQESTAYREAHCTGAVNISRANIVVNKPYPNMLAPASQMEQILSARGISKESTVIIYDNNKNMDAARLWWSLLVYGHDNAKVVSGGFEALKAAGMSVDSGRVAVKPTDYTIETNRSQYVASTGDVKAEVDNPHEDICIIDTRTTEEFNDGTIPTSVHIDFARNNFKDGTYKPVRQILILYDDFNIAPDDTVIVFCKTSVRAAQTFLALYNAGYRDVKVYDAAWLGWSADSSLPVQRPNGDRVAPTVQDGS